MSVCILPMAEQFGYSDPEKGLIASAFSLGYCLGLAPVGAAASATSPKAVLTIGLIVWSLAQAASPAAASAGLPMLLAARAVMGVGEAAAIPSIQAVAANFVPATSRSSFWGILTASLSCGTIGSYLIAPPLIESRGWEAVFLVFGGVGVVLAGLWGAIGRAEPAATASIAAAGDAPAAAAVSLDTVPWRQIASSRPVWALTASHASHNFFTYFGLAWLPTYFNYQFGLATSDASSAALLPFIAGAIGSLSSGAACDALVARANVSQTDARKILQTIGCLGPALSMLALFLISEGVGGLTLSREAAEALFVFAIGSSAASAAGFGCGAQDISTRLSSLIYGASSVAGVVAGATSQYLTGWLLEANGRDFGPIFGLMTGVELLGALAFCAWWSSEPEFE